MPALYAYPVTKYDPAPLIDLSRAEQRARLSRGALRAFFNIVERWKLKDSDARALLGGVSNGVYYAWKKQPDGRTLDEDTLRRISYLVGIFKALNIVYSERLADAWISLPNTNRIFAGAPPLRFMISGGAPAFETVRRLLDARRG
ncbi:MAG: antitoxin Xre-like helix-turn-helix domain-containing protein [Alphaproteobacteria bacterium]